MHGKTLRFQLAQSEWRSSRNSDKCWQDCEEKRNPFTVLAAVQISVVIVEISLEVPQKS